MHDTPPLPRHFFDLEEEFPDITLAAPGAGESAASRATGQSPGQSQGGFGPRLLGVFSSKEKGRSGKTYWLAEQTGPDSLSARILDQDGQPSGLPVACTRTEFLRRFEPEVAYFGERVLPGLDQAVRGDALRGQASFQARRENPREAGARAIFELGMFYLKGQDEERSRAVFKDLARLPGPFEAEHKHLFNEFGMALRKNHFYDEALSHYERAVSLGQDDENVHFNMARAFHAKGDWTGCVQALTECLERNPQLAAARKFCLHLARKEEEKAMRLETTHPNMAKIILAESRRLTDRMLEAAGIDARETAELRRGVRERLARSGRVRGLA